MSDKSMFKGASAALIVAAIVCGGAAPAFTQTVVPQDQTFDLTEDHNGQQIVFEATDGNGNPVAVDSVNLVSGPEHHTCTGTGDRRECEPSQPHWYGTDIIDFEVVSGGVTSTTRGKITLNVAPQPDAPIAKATTEITLQEDTTSDVITLQASDPDLPEGDPDNVLVYEVSTPPSNGALNTTMGKEITYTPNDNFAGQDFFTFKVTDETGRSDTGRINLTVNPVNDTPVAMSQMVEVIEDGEITITLMAMDADGDRLTFSTMAPMHGTLTGVAPALTYAPDPDFAGIDTFTFRASDPQGAMSNQATVTITVGDANDPPYFDGATPAEGATLMVAEGDTLTFTLETTDADGDSITYGIDGLEMLSGATFDAASGTFSWTPTWREVGTYMISLTATDGRSSPVSRPVTLQVTERDSDGDGLSDTLETELGTDPNSQDSDDDGISDFDEVDAENGMAIDTDGDGTIDALDSDSDGDGVRDSDEVNDLELSTTPPDSDADGTPDFQDPDSDNDGTSDAMDNCRLTPNANQVDTDGDGMGDLCDPDIDNDGVENTFDGCLYEPGPRSGCPEREQEPEEGGLCSGNSVAGAPRPISPGLLVLAGLALLGLIGRVRRR